jgi:hypothetical protein
LSFEVVRSNGSDELLARATALLERQAAGVMRERDWRQSFIRGKAPEDAARRAETLYWNSRPPLERTRER